MKIWANGGEQIPPEEEIPPVTIIDPFVKLTLESVGGKKQIFIKEK